MLRWMVRLAMGPEHNRFERQAQRLHQPKSIEVADYTGKIHTPLDEIETFTSAKIIPDIEHREAVENFPDGTGNLTEDYDGEEAAPITDTNPPPQVDDSFPIFLKFAAVIALLIIAFSTDSWGVVFFLIILPFAGQNDRSSNKLKTPGLNIYKTRPMPGEQPQSPPGHIDTKSPSSPGIKATTGRVAPLETDSPAFVQSIETTRDYAKANPQPAETLPQSTKPSSGKFDLLTYGMIISFSLSALGLLLFLENGSSQGMILMICSMITGIFLSVIKGYLHSYPDTKQTNPVSVSGMRNKQPAETTQDKSRTKKNKIYWS